MDISSRHHYIPRFLIKNFCDSDNKLWVYNKEERRVLKTKQSPKAIFFEWGRNTFSVNGEFSDNIEKMYAEVDDLLSKTLEKILSTQTMSGREQTLIIFLVSLMKWRIPKIDNLFHDLVKNIPIEDLGLKLRPIDMNTPVDNEVLKKIQEMDIVNETKRLLLPIQPLIREENLDEIHRNCFMVNDERYPALLGDCPIIEAQNQGFETLENFIFPLGTRDTFVCKRGAKREISNHLFYIQKDLAIFHLSTKYVACSDREQLLRVVEMYSKLEKENKTHLILKYVFEFVK
jgi:hypothetical protein